MSEAARWQEICGTRVARSATPIVDDPVCRGLLRDAAVRTVCCGADGWMWIFEDRSQLIANRQIVVVT